MYKTTTALTLSLAALAPALAPTLAEAREVTFTTQLQNYGGNAAYLAMYVTDAAGAYQGTLWLSGGRVKYWRHLRDWYRASGGSVVDGVTGASVGSGRSLTVTVDLADALIDAGYQIRVDTAVENIAEHPAEVSVPLTLAGSGQPVPGTGFVQSFQYDIK